MTNVAERSHVKALERRARLKAAQNAEVLRGIMSNPFGREWMHDLLAQCHIGTTPFSTNAMQMSFNCGEQNVGLTLWATLQTICPDLYILMMQEEQARAARNDIDDRERNVNPDNYDSDGAEPVTSEFEPGRD